MPGYWDNGDDQPDFATSHDMSQAPDMSEPTSRPDFYANGYAPKYGEYGENPTADTLSAAETAHNPYTHTHTHTHTHNVNSSSPDNAVAQGEHANLSPGAQYGFDYSANSKFANAKRNAKYSNRSGAASKAKWILPIGLPLLSVGGIVGLVMMAVLPFLMIANVLQNDIGFFAGRFVQHRLVAIVKSVSKYAKSLSVGGLDLQSTEVGRFVAANKMPDELTAQGISFDGDGNMKIDIGADNGMTSYSGKSGAALTDATPDSIAKDLGIDGDKISLGSERIEGVSRRVATVDMKALKTSENMILENRLVLSTRAGPIARRVAAMKIRLASTKAVARVMDFHPIKDLKAWIKSKTTDRLGRLLFNAINSKLYAGIGEKAYQQVIKNAKVPDGGTIPPEIIQDAEKAKQAAINDAAKSMQAGTFKGTVRNMLKRVIKQTTLDKIGDFTTKAAEGIKLGFASLVEQIVSLICMLEGIEESFGEDTWTQVVMPAMAHAGDLLAIASEMQAGFQGYDNVKDPTSDDCTVGATGTTKYSDNDDEAEATCENIEPAEQVQVAAKRFVCNDQIQVVEVDTDGTTPVTDATTMDDKGNSDPTRTVDGSTSYTPTDGTVSDCFSNSATYKAVTGQGTPSADEIADTVPYAATTMGTSVQDILAGTLGTAGTIVGSLIHGVYEVVNEIPLGNQICGFMNSLLGGILTSLLATLIDAAIGVISGGTYTALGGSAATAISLGLIGLFTGIGMLTSGQSLTVDQSTTPSQSFSIASYGALAADKLTTTSTEGGLNISNSDAVAIWSGQQQYLAMEWDKKPLLAKIFDGSDPRSVVATIQSTANIDPTDKNVGTFFANFAKLMGATPRLFATAISGIGGAAHASDSQLFGGYDFGFAVSGYTPYEMQVMNDDDKYDPIQNAQYIKDHPGIIVSQADKLEKCFLSTIDPNTLAVSILDNSDGSKYNLQDSKDGCSADNLALKPGSSANEDLFRLRVYMLDYSTLKSESCSADGYSGGDCADYGF